MEENNNEQAKQTIENWHINEMNAKWKIQRENAKRRNKENIANAAAERDKHLRAIEDNAMEEKAKIEAVYNAMVKKSEESLNEDMMAIAREQDGYMHDFKLYLSRMNEMMIKYEYGKE